MADRPDDKALPTLAAELWEMVVAYLKQETIEPIKALGRFLALGLEFLLAADILRIAVAPSFEEIGKLAAIAAIRTLLNYFLRKEIDKERSELDEAP